MSQAFERLGRHRPMIRKTPAVLEIAEMKAFERLVEITHDLSLVLSATDGAQKVSGTKHQSTAGTAGCYDRGAFPRSSRIRVPNAPHLTFLPSDLQHVVVNATSQPPQEDFSPWPIP